MTKKIIVFILNRLQYFYKSSSYKNEKEIRVLCTVSDEDKYGSAPENENWGWDVLKFAELKFGDIIQVYRANGDIRRFRVIYRASNPGDAFGPDGEGYIRICYASKYEDIKEALRRMEEAFGTK